MPNSLTPHQSLYVLEKAIADRKLSQADVNRYVASMHEEIVSLESRLAALKEAVAARIPWILHRPPAPDSVNVPKARRRKPVSAERRASMQLQGQYLGLLSGVPKNQRAKYQKIAKEEGREKAIEALKKGGKVITR